MHMSRCACSTPAASHDIPLARLLVRAHDLVRCTANLLALVPVEWPAYCSHYVVLQVGWRAVTQSVQDLESDIFVFIMHHFCKKMKRESAYNVISEGNERMSSQSQNEQ